MNLLGLVHNARHIDTADTRIVPKLLPQACLHPPPILHSTLCWIVNWSLDTFHTLRSRRSGKHVLSKLSFGGIKKKTSFFVKVDPLTPVDDHTDSLSIPMSQYTGVTTFNKEGCEKEDEQDQGMI